jgi:uncharacterized membrane protein (DUF485 family)
MDVERLAGDPRFEELTRRRGRLAGVLTAVMLIGYFGFLLLVAFAPDVLATPVAGGATTLGIPVGLGLIALAIVLTAIYVRAANRHFDPLVEALGREPRA